MQPLVVAIADTKAVSILRGLGYRTALLGAPLSWDAILLADAPIEADLDRWEDVEAKLSALHAATPIQAVVSARPAYMPLAAYLAARWGLPGPGLGAVLNCASLIRTRRILEASGISTVRWAPAMDQEGAVCCASTLGMPVVLRSLERVVGDDAFVCHSLETIQHTARRMSTRSPVLLVEEFEPGPLFVVQSVARRGESELLAVFEAAVSAGPRYAIAALRHPPVLSPALQTLILARVDAVLAGLNIDGVLASTYLRTSADGDCKVLGVELGVPDAPLARLTEVVAGVQLTRTVVELALRLPLERRPAFPRRASVLYWLYFEEAGFLQYRDDVVRRADTDSRTMGSATIHLEATPGTAILPGHHPDGRAHGWILASGDDHQRAMSRYLHALKLLALRPSPALAEFARAPAQATVPAVRPAPVGPEATQLMDCHE